MKLASALLLCSILSAEVYIVQGDRAATRAAVLAAGGRVLSHPDLRDDHILADLLPDQLARVQRSARAFPASADIAAGHRVIACPVREIVGAPARLTFTVGDGWDGPGQNAVTLKYVFGNTSTYGGLSSAQFQYEVLAQLAKWSSVAAVDFVAGTGPLADKTLYIFVSSGDHGDGWPLGPGAELAHAFYPGSPYWNDSIAGDVHFNGNYSWVKNWEYSATNFSVDHVALHESGHALGLAHSETAGTVMWPYYSTNVPVPMDLQPGDIESIRALYAYRDTPVPPPPAPPDPRETRSGGSIAVLVNSFPTSVDTATITLTGTITGGALPITLTWATDRGYSGVGTVSTVYTSSGPYTYFSATVPLDVGTNSIALSARDANSGSGAAAITITRTSSGGGRENR